MREHQAVRLIDDADGRVAGKATKQRQQRDAGLPP